jgi:hypothetical protein
MPHPPPFNANDRLSDWPLCLIEAACSECGRRTVIPISLLFRTQPDARIMDVARRLRCGTCGIHAAPVYLCEGFHRQGGHGGPQPGWSLELVPAGQ